VARAKAAHDREQAPTAEAEPLRVPGALRTSASTHAYATKLNGFRQRKQRELAGKKA
jgi:hypothetical protein